MTATTVTAPDPGVRSIWLREYHLSLALLGAGAVLFGGALAFKLWSGNHPNYPVSFWLGLAVNVSLAGGFALLPLACTIAVIRRSQIRTNGRVA